MNFCVSHYLKDNSQIKMMSITGRPPYDLNTLKLSLEKSVSFQNYSAHSANVMLQLYQLARDGCLDSYQFLNEIASSSNDTFACGYLAVLLKSEKVNGIDKNVDRANSMMKDHFPWLIESSQEVTETSKHINYLLGVCYSEGLGISENLDEALYHFTISAKMGNVAAQNSLGLAHCKGLGTDANFTIGAYYYQQSADQHNTLGHYNAGVCFKHGAGVQQNDEEAHKRFRFAATRGHRLSQNAAKNLRVHRDQNWLVERYKKIYSIQM